MPTLNCAPHYYLVPGDNTGSLVLGSDLTLTGKRKDPANQWKLESAGKGFYKILNRENGRRCCRVRHSSHDLVMSDAAGKENQVWKIENAHNGLFRISNKQFPNIMLSVNTCSHGREESRIAQFGEWFFFWLEIYRSLRDEAGSFQTAFDSGNH